MIQVLYPPLFFIINKLQTLVCVSINLLSVSHPHNYTKTLK